MSEIDVNIENVKNILKLNLSIPFFQRPYCWKEENVKSLLQDINESLIKGKQSFRIGSIILYKAENNNDFQIVDGQQRITTLLLIFRSLENEFAGKELCSSLKYDHDESWENICQNNKFISKWFENYCMKKEFYKYLAEHCEFVKIIVNDLSEAFQMFDSQNGRGKELEAYNLLKAYHIRAMEAETQETRIDCDKRWESSTRYKINPDDEQDQGLDVLKQVINEHLYRTREWCRKSAAWEFDKSNIAEFKGLSIDKQHIIKFPFQNPQLLQYVAIKYFESIGLSVTGIKARFLKGDTENINPFVLINQNIINGKHFFDYMETYVEIYKRLFMDLQKEPLMEFKKFYIENCLKYNGANRTGDTYLREVYKSFIFLVFDKYGEEGVKKNYEMLYLLVYRLRLIKERVMYNTVAQYPSNYFAYIENSIDLNFQFLNTKANEEIKCEKEVNGIIPVFLKNGIKIKNINLENYNHE